MQLLMLGPSLDVQGGVSSVERLILDRIPPEVHATHIATMAGGNKFVKLLVFIKSMAAVRQQLEQNVDLVHIHFASDASSVRKEVLARQVLRRGTKVIMHAHGAEYRRYWAQMTRAQRRRTLDVLTRISALIVLGEVWRDFFVTVGVPAERIVILPNPVQLPVSLPERRAKPFVKFVYLGIIDHRKGAFDLLEAVCGLSLETRARCRFEFAGNGEAVKLRKLVAKHRLDRLVTVHDWIDANQRDELLAGADVFVLPSRNEGMPMAMLEAMAWGLPVLCTPVGSIPELVKDGYNGLLVEPGNVSAIATAVTRLVGDDDARTAMGLAARKSVEPLAIENYMNRLVALYHSVLGRPARE